MTLQSTPFNDISTDHFCSIMSFTLTRMTFAKKSSIYLLFSKTKDIYHLIHLVLAMGPAYGAGKGRRVNLGGHAARGGHTLREIWHSSNTTMEFAEWVRKTKSTSTTPLQGVTTQLTMVSITTQPLTSGTLMAMGLPIKCRLHQLQQHHMF